MAKIRQGFISNSSSSSFILSQYKEDRLIIKLDLTDSCTTITTVEELNEKVFKYWDPEDLKDNIDYKIAKEELARGKIIRYIKASSESDYLEDILYGMELDNTMVGQRTIIIKNGEN